ncbi:ABC transporter substrate-binding protein [Leptolyngbya sp. CCNP1308]|uniref:ABC transporter substrate-binding protein n=1 Tax=Leptolyngbya sp. CCNP1308 TaxID=3110255 RepID=UPI002B20125D|nr:ABC transporter substrate-binding protein [Leptolyngbya sp. CCNP1308]MEA5451745.1 ABC transporter substrate-binding protein [Leptolyngbya sp. CCNP1308]
MPTPTSTRSPHRQRFHRRCSPLALAMGLWLTACQPPPTGKVTTPEPAIALADASETTVTLPQPAERIVCLHLSCIDILAELDLVPLAVGHPRLADWAKSPIYFGEAASQIAIVGGPEPNLEALLALRPDLIIGYRGQVDGLRATLAPIAPLFLLEVSSAEQAIANLHQVGQLTDRAAAAEVAAQTFRDRLAAHQDQAQRDRTVLVTNGTQGTFYVATRESLVGSTLAELVDYPWSLGDRTPSAINWAVFSTEHILQVDPDVIFVLVPDPAPDLRATLAQDAVWGNLTAVKAGQLYDLSDAEVGGLTTGTRSLSHLLNAIMAHLTSDS